MIRYKYQQVGNVKVFYREAGDPQKPTILLLHGFPSSSVQFRELIPELMDDYHLIAPAMPSFGYILQNSISHGKMIEMISSIVLLASSDTAGT